MPRVESWLASLTCPAIAVSHSAVSRVIRGLLLGLGKSEILHLPVPQDRFFRIADGRVEWLEAARRTLAPSIDNRPHSQ
jgi:probable phosphoglycerate mutase